MYKRQPYGTETAGEVQDGYLKHYVPAKSKTFREPGAYHLRGEHRIAGGLGVATALMPCLLYTSTHRILFRLHPAPCRP